MNLKGYYFITDAGLSRKGNINDVREAVKAGACAVQYRNKEGNTEELIREAAALKSLCGAVPFIVNDRVDVALAVNADGVHLGQDDTSYGKARGLLGRMKAVGITVHDVKEALEAERMGADYLGVSPIFATGTKPDAGAPAGLELIKAVKKDVKIPVVAIGGINLDNASEVIAAGADSLCAISAVVAGGDVKAEIEKFLKLFR
ncbi:MAG: thiamine phosphate synthase [Elusimicrobiota bacterium]